MLDPPYSSHAPAPVAHDWGHDGHPFSKDDHRCALRLADLDAYYARACGLIRDEQRHARFPADVKCRDDLSETFHPLREREFRQQRGCRARRLHQLCVRAPFGRRSPR
jgi:hypothetical protein